MANMKHVNQYIKTNYPNLDIEAIRGSGYVYFDGLHGFGCIDSIWSNPTTTSTSDLADMCLQNIADAYPEEEEE